LTLKQKICGFKGHEFELFAAPTAAKRTAHVRLICSKCGFGTAWYSLRKATKTTDLLQAKEE